MNARLLALCSLCLACGRTGLGLSSIDDQQTPQTPHVDPQPPACAAAAPRRFEVLARDVRSAVRGACDALAWEATDGSLWLSAAGAAPLQLAAAGTALRFSPSGALLSWFSAQTLWLRSADGALAQASVPASSCLPNAPHCAPQVPRTFFTVSPAGAERVVAESFTDFLVLAPDGAQERVQRPHHPGASPGALRDIWLAIPEAGDGVVVLVGGEAVSVSLSRGTAQPWKRNGQPLALDEMNDTLLLSRDGTVAVHQARREEFCGDTFCEKLDGPSRLFDTATGEVLAEAGPLRAGLAGNAQALQAGQVFAAPKEGHVLGVASGDGFVAVARDGRARTVTGLRLRGFPAFDVALVSAPGFPNASVRLQQLATGLSTPLLDSEAVPVASSDGEHFAASHFSDRCVKHPDGHACHTQVWELTRARRSSGPLGAPTTFSTQPLRLVSTLRGGDVLTFGRLFDGAPPASSAPEAFQLIEDRLWWLAADGRRAPLAQQGGLRVVETPAANYLSSATSVHRLDAATLTARSVLSDPAGVALLEDDTSESLAVVGGPAEAHALWFGRP